jgi:hypothetical protein
MPSNCPVKIQLTFDRSFVPSKLGINTDTRKLVMRTRQDLDAASPG